MRMKLRKFALSHENVSELKLAYTVGGRDVMECVCKERGHRNMDKMMNDPVHFRSRRPNQRFKWP